MMMMIIMTVVVVVCCLCHHYIHFISPNRSSEKTQTHTSYTVQIYKYIHAHTNNIYTQTTDHLRGGS